MVNKCSALNCRSGYSGKTKDPNITFHSFPFHDENLMKIWLKNIARKDFKPMKYITSTAESIQAELLFNVFPNENDAAIIFYVCGYCCRSMAKTNRCDACKEATVEEVDEFLPFVEESVPSNAIKFFNDINRGGLWKPISDFYEIGILCWRIFAELSTTALKHQFLLSDYQREVFKEIVNISFFDGRSIPPWTVASRCNNGHALVEGIATPFFNCMSKNLVRDLSSVKNNRVARKIRKLNGKTNATQ